MGRLILARFVLRIGKVKLGINDPQMCTQKLHLFLWAHTHLYMRKKSASQCVPYPPANHLQSRGLR